MVIWANHDGDSNFLRGKYILKEPAVTFKLTKLGWKIPWRVLNYKAADRDPYEKTAEYLFAYDKFNFDYFFHDEDFLEYDSSYNSDDDDDDDHDDDNDDVNFTKLYESESAKFEEVKNEKKVEAVCNIFDDASDNDEK